MGEDATALRDEMLSLHLMSTRFSTARTHGPARARYVLTPCEYSQFSDDLDVKQPYLPETPLRCYVHSAARRVGIIEAPNGIAEIRLTPLAIEAFRRLLSKKTSCPEKYSR